VPRTEPEPIWRGANDPTPVVIKQLNKRLLSPIKEPTQEGTEDESPKKEKSPAKEQEPL